jgi:tetratricopeptide (TPR) repeat protein
MDAEAPFAEGDAPERLLEEVRPALERLLERHRVPLAAAARLLVAAAVGVQGRLGPLPGAKSRLIKAVDEACQGATSAEPGGDDYGRAFAAAAARLRRRRRRAERERAAARALLVQLLALPAEARRAAVGGDRRFSSVALAELLLDRARAAWTDDPGRCEPLAELALAVLDRLPAGPAERAAAADLRALGWTSIANGRRILFDLAGAEAALARAAALLAEGSGDPRERALHLTVTASLRRAQRRFDEALRALEQATAIHRWARDRHQEGQALIGRAIVFAYAGNPERAIPLVRHALALIDRERDPRLYFAACNNLAGYLHEAGRTEEARRLLPKVRQLAGEAGDRLDLLAVRWLEGQIEVKLGDPARGEATLLGVRDDSLREGLAYNAALISLELVALYLEQGRAAEARRLAAEMVPVFHSRDIHREALAALIALQRATELDAATVDLVREIASLMRWMRAGGPPPPEEPS